MAIRVEGPCFFSDYFPKCNNAAGERVHGAVTLPGDKKLIVPVFCKASTTVGSPEEQIAAQQKHPCFKPRV